MLEAAMARLIDVSASRPFSGLTRAWL